MHTVIELLAASCFLADKDSPGFDISHNASIMSSTQCQKWCQANLNCRYFVVNERNEGNNGCWLKNSTAITQIKTRAGVTYGPKYCPSGGTSNKYQ